MSVSSELRQGDHRFHWLVESLPDLAMFLMDLEGHIMSWNTGAAHVFGYQEAEIVGQHFGVLFTPEDRRNGEPERELREVREEGQAADKRWHLRKDGSRFWADGTVRQVYDDAGKVIGLAKVLRNIGDRKELEDALMEQVRTLSDANKRKDDFMVLLAHEFRNPLTPILNALHIIRQEETTDPAQQQARGMIERQVRSLTRLVDELLEVTRLQRGQAKLRKERVSLNNIMRRAIDSVHEAIEERQQNLSVQFPDQPLWLDADPARLKQAVEHLLLHATRSTDSGGGVWLTGEREGDAAVLRVRDTGVGIDPRVLPYIFDPFSQAGRMLDHVEVGLYIGLALVKRVVELHGGTVEARSEGLHMGSEFILRLPLPGQRVQERQEPVAENRNGLRVLVVEDNVDIANSLAMVLRLSGYDVSVQHTGLRGLEEAMASPPHAAIIDIGLPELDGWQIARRLRSQLGDRKPTLMAMSGYGTEEDRRKSTQAGFDHHLTKPVSPEKLLALLRSDLKHVANPPSA
jgi:PAS domain S-box-containing protein